MKLSLIIATLNRVDSLYSLLDSIYKSELDSNLEVEVIIVDQNDLPFLDFERYLNTRKGFNLIHLRSTKKGLSHNRNIGLRRARGDVIAFPDDDCLYYSDTLREVVNFLQISEANFVCGRIYDRNRDANVFKSWPASSVVIGEFRSYYLNSSITLFVRSTSLIEFDERLGVGAAFGSCEDADYVLRLVHKFGYGEYSPNIEVWHPSPDSSALDCDKVYLYAKGFGFYCRKHMSPMVLLILFLVTLKNILRVLDFKITFSTRLNRLSFFYRGLLSGISFVDAKDFP